MSDPIVGQNLTFDDPWTGGQSTITWADWRNSVLQGRDNQVNTIIDQATAYKGDLQNQVNSALASYQDDFNKKQTLFENSVLSKSLPSLSQPTSKGDASPMKKWMIYGAVGLALYYFYKKGKLK